MTRDELAETLATQAGVAQAEATTFIDALATVLTDRLGNGDNVELPSLGVFELVRRKERKGRNPKTGAALTIPAATIVNFKPTASLKRAVNP